MPPPISAQLVLGVAGDLLTPDEERTHYLTKVGGAAWVPAGPLGDAVDWGCAARCGVCSKPLSLVLQVGEGGAGMAGWLGAPVAAVRNTPGSWTRQSYRQPAGCRHTKAPVNPSTYTHTHTHGNPLDPPLLKHPNPLPAGVCPPSRGGGPCPCYCSCACYCRRRRRV